MKAGKVVGVPIKAALFRHWISKFESRRLFFGQAKQFALCAVKGDFQGLSGKAGGDVVEMSAERESPYCADLPKPTALLHVQELLFGLRAIGAAGASGLREVLERRSSIQGAGGVVLVEEEQPCLQSALESTGEEEALVLS